MRAVRLSAAAIAASLVWTACSASGPARVVMIEPGTNFSLRVGESAQTRDGALRLGFEGVTSDSRCAKGEQCVWAGDAVVRVWLQQGAGPRQTRELHAASGATQTVHVPGQELRLVSLDPYPVAGKTVATSDYVATLALSKISAAESDR